MAFAKKWSDEIRAICLAKMLEGQTVNSVSQASGVPVRTLMYWKSRDNQGPMVAVEEKRQIGVLLVQNLQVGLQSMLAIQTQFQNPDWLNRQGAAELATSYGIINDKMVRLVEAMQPVPAEGDEDSEG